MNLLIKNLAETSANAAHLQQDKAFQDTFSNVVKLLKYKVEDKHRIFVAGNGGSAADAQHFVAELVGRFEKEREPINAEALSTDTSVLTAIGNDYGYDEVFKRQLAAKADKWDLFIAITTSGNSENILKALRYCKDSRIVSVVLTGGTGGKAAELADYTLAVNLPFHRTSNVQTMHQVIYHSLAEALDA